MKTNVYETSVLINASLDDEQIESLISRIKDNIVNNGGEVRDMENWGRKRLAYPVNKSKIGYYAIFRFNAPSNAVAKLERAYNLDDQVLRYLTVSLDTDAIEHIEKNKVSNVEVDSSSSKSTEENTKNDVKE